MDSNNRIEEFACLMFNFFENDYLIIKDFMQKDTPWNEIFCLNLKITDDELFQLKTDLLSKMIFSYQYDVIYPIQYSNKSEKSFCEPDIIVYKDILRIKEELEKNDMYSEDNLVSAYSEYININTFAFIQIVKYYFSLLSIQGYKLEKNNCNAFRNDIKNMYEIYDNLQVNTGLIYMENQENQEKYNIFYNKLFNEEKKYIDNSFRTKYEKSIFIKYLVSLVYAYLKSLNNLTDEDEMILEMIENNETFVGNIFNYKDLFCLVLEIIYNLYYDYGEYYDFRDRIKDNYEVINKLDNTFKEVENPKYKMDSLYTEVYLELVFESFELDKMSIDEVFNYLMSHKMSIYDRLYESYLDPRFEQEYKQDLIRKIVADTYEYQCYLDTCFDVELSNNHYKKLKDIDTSKFENILEYFVDNYSSLIENYYIYQHETVYFNEKARLQICKLRELDKIIEINKFSISRYLSVLAKKVIELPSVDYMNKCIQAISNGYKDYEYDDIIKMLSVMCLNIYEKILLDKVEGDAMPYLKSYIENTEDIGEHLMNDETTRKNLEKLFIELNGPDVSYFREVKARKKIDDNYQKILKKLNPFDE